MNYNEYIEDHTLRCEAGYRGGGIEIDCSELFPYIEAKTGEYAGLTAYQNYLGGGMLGSIRSSNNFADALHKRDVRKFEILEDSLKRYFHDLTNPLHDEDWEQTSYERNQDRPASGY